jgi:hypothetical protein
MAASYFDIFVAGMCVKLMFKIIVQKFLDELNIIGTANRIEPSTIIRLPALFSLFSSNPRPSFATTAYDQRKYMVKK